MILFVVTFAAALCFSAGCTLIAKTPLGAGIGFITAPSLRVGEPVILAKSEYNMEHGYFSFPQVFRFSDDLLIVGFSTEGDTGHHTMVTVDPNGELLPGPFRAKSPLISSDNGKTWIARPPPGLPYTNGTNAPVFWWHYGRKNPEALRVTIKRRDGSTVSINNQVMTIQRRWAQGSLRQEWEGISARMESPDGHHWLPPTDVFFQIPSLQKSVEFGEAVRLFGNGLELPDGTLLLSGYAWRLTPYRFESPRGRTAILLASTDGGNTFTTRSVIASGRDVSGPQSDGPSEPALVRLPSGELFAVMRTGGLPGTVSDYMIAARSSDDGATWKVSPFNRRGVGPKLLVLSDGTLLCGYGRPSVALIASSDGGHTWGRTHYLLPSDSRATTGYMDMIEVSPGEVFVVYDTWDYDINKKKHVLPGDGRNVVMGRFVRVGTDVDHP